MCGVGFDVGKGMWYRLIVHLLSPPRYNGGFKDLTTGRAIVSMEVEMRLDSIRDGGGVRSSPYLSVWKRRWYRSRSLPHTH